MILTILQSKERKQKFVIFERNQISSKSLIKKIVSNLNWILLSQNGRQVKLIKTFENLLAKLSYDYI